MSNFELISFEDAELISDKPGYIIVDLRDRADYFRGHIENAINIEGGTLEDIKRFERKNYTWVLYCTRGSASFKLASEMASVGYEVIAVVGGYKNIEN